MSLNYPLDISTGRILQSQEADSFYTHGCNPDGDPEEREPPRRSFDTTGHAEFFYF
jgi:hypothetical protein